jgi:hypothetical protein
VRQPHQKLFREKRSDHFHSFCLYDLRRALHTDLRMVHERYVRIAPVRPLPPVFRLLSVRSSVVERASTANRRTPQNLRRAPDQTSARLEIAVNCRALWLRLDMRTRPGLPDPAYPPLEQIRAESMSAAEPDPDSR